RKADGTPVLTGTASVGPDHGTTALDRRLAELNGREAGELFIVDQLAVGMTVDEPHPVAVTFDEGNGPGYPFSLAAKGDRITEPHPGYTPEGGAASPWGRAILPVEMISVLAQKAGRGLPVRSPALGLFLDLEIRLL